MERSYGFTIIEILVVISIMAILAALAIPSYLDFFEKGRLRGATEAVYEQLQYARAQALKRSTPIIVDFSADGSTSWELGISDKSGCDATEPLVTETDACVIEYDNDPDTDYDGDGKKTDHVLMRLLSTDFSNITMKGSGVAPSPLFDTDKDATTTPKRLDACATTASVYDACFEPIRGLSRKTATHIQLENGDYKLQVRVDEVGGVTICRPIGEKYFVGYNECPD
jgi:type IV fimbrial biogenesis protein FimT